MKKFTVFTDGASRGNPGPGGWAYIISDGHIVEEKGGHEEHTTNNRMELVGVIEALQYVIAHGDKESSVTIHTDSAYVINGITKWLSGWIKNNWQTKTKEAVKNEDLWKILGDLVGDFEIDWVRISGHAGIPGNERADEIATAYADKEKIKLFKDKQDSYGRDLSITRSSHTISNKKKSNKGVAYSYVSKVGGKIYVDKIWKDCEKRVKGVSGTRFKKSLSTEDEKNIIAEFSR